MSDSENLTKEYIQMNSEYSNKIEKITPRRKKLVLFTVFFILALLFIIIIFRVAWHDIITGHLFAIGLILLISIVIPLPIIVLSTSYLYEDLSKEVFIDRGNKMIIIKKKNKEIIITKSDIVKSFHVKTLKTGRARHNLENEYEYVLLVLKERKRIFITNLLIEPKEIISFFSLNCTEIIPMIPLIDRKMGSGVLTTDEFEQKVKEFEHSFHDTPNEKLHSIIRDKKVYASHAIEAARRILEKRKLRN